MLIMACISIGVYAINANEITYKETTVDSALDDLYTITATKQNLVYIGEVNLSNSNTPFTIDCTSIENYQNLTENNFVLELVSFSNSGNNISGNYSSNLTKSYDSTTGILSVSRGSMMGSTANIKLNVYAHY